ncbi:MAG TPA: adenylosuccinate lyase [Acholeplasmataceae bacterium]|nr:MAG: adenylosuccinate lyase [Tenericutes bacterium GWA2_38_26]OHE31034.1 MAG: adenylosuccinate lyase [Tenericutes bacterium GWC2_39_45]OHE32181.1 MAG: adenylosuccinate lyase [Tenericutes bacterium GWD2_38_27]OHE40874.1 MAG: adenylosuccinate lyase [Tenericutes bacterium GWE2_38_8]HBG32147.1 adenylosuccinate lyase [Acholeplasmataceae bacterium]
MISRYSRQIMTKIWSENHKFDQFLKVELACSHAWMHLGLITLQEYQALSKATYKLEDINRIELEVKHDVIAFTKAVSLSLGEEKKWLHYGLTSTDVVDTAQSLILREVNQVIKEDIKGFMSVLKDKALLYKHTPSIGRTHGIHAEVTSFGLKFALWHEDFKRLNKLFIEASKLVEVAKISGAVGNYSASTPKLQELTAQELNLTESNISTQTLQRDRHANYLSVIALIGAELDKIATEIRHLSRTEVGEVSEFFDVNQKGSSAMPHKKNPVSSENISGLSRVLKGYAVTALDNIALWHERDISHSSAERIILADSTTLIDYMLNRYKNTLSGLVVNPDVMIKNIDKTHGVIFAQDVLHLMIKKGFDREKGYDLIQKMALQSLNTHQSFKELLIKNEDIHALLNPNDLDQAFDISKYLRYVDDIYQKVFN